MTTNRDWYMGAARLLHAAPGIVFDALATAAAKEDSFFRVCDDETEAALLERNDPVINLALAAYGRDTDVIKVLYQSGLPDTGSALAKKYKAELRRACLSNRVACRFGTFHFGFAATFGDRERAPLLCTGDLQDACTLIQNPTVGDRHLACLYKHAGPFADLADDRWLYLVGSSGDNPRIATEHDSPDGPDIGSWDIQEAIPHLFTAAPATDHWASELVRLLNALDPAIVRGNPRKTTITADVLARWIDVKGHFDEIYTSLTIGQLLCCMVAALYGAPSVGSDSAAHETENWPARLARCAHYAKGKLSEKELDTGYAKDGEAFGIAVLCNDSVLCDDKLREYLERHCLRGREIWQRYEQRCTQLQQRSPWVRPLTITEDDEQSSKRDVAPDQTAVAISELSKSLDGRLDSLKRWIIAGFVVLALILLAHW